jgi:hypothetical protein
MRLRVLFAALVVAGACLGPSAALASGVWSAPDKIGTGLGLVSVSCSSATFCAVVGTNGGPSGYAVTYNGTSWSPTHIGIVAGAVSCASASFCVALGEGGHASTYNGRSWSVGSVGSPGPLGSVSCASTSFCVAVDGKNAVTYTTATAPKNTGLPIIKGKDKEQSKLTASNGK